MELQQQRIRKGRRRASKLLVPQQHGAAVRLQHLAQDAGILFQQTIQLIAPHAASLFRMGQRQQLLRGRSPHTHQQRHDLGAIRKVFHQGVATVAEGGFRQATPCWHKAVVHGGQHLTRSTPHLTQSHLKRFKDFRDASRDRCHFAIIDLVSRAHVACIDPGAPGYGQRLLDVGNTCGTGPRLMVNALGGQIHAGNQPFHHLAQH
mmetsp:Transcript_70843/g.169073  ORF Transcript_70843/g.169073 Transcript_70843/m.169073 type:complete len:205 (+) Transcript_70843:122-736(+)